MSKLKILYLEDAQYDVEIVQEHLAQEQIDFHLIHASNREEYVQALKNNELDIILADFALPSLDGLEALELTQQFMPDIPFIIISGVMGEELAIEALKSGATDYVLKQRLGRLIPSIRRAMLEANQRRERKMFENELN